MIPKEDVIGFFKACYDDSEPTVALDNFAAGPLHKESMIPWRRSIIQHAHPLVGKYWPTPMGFSGMGNLLNKLSRTAPIRCTLEGMLNFIEAVYDSSTDRIVISDTGYPVKVTALEAIHKAMGDTSVDTDAVLYSLSELAAFLDSQMLL